MCDFLFQLSGVRCENLVELKEHFAGDELLTKSLEELPEGKNWGAACGKIVFTLVRRLGNEHKRLCVQIPRIAEKEQLLGKIWEHDLWFVRLVRQRAVSFGQLFDRAKAGSSNLLPVIAELNLLTGSFGSPFYHRLIWAKQAFEGLERVFWAASGISEKARGQLRKGLWFLKAHEEWLLKADSYLESKKPPQEMPVLKEAVR